MRSSTAFACALLSAASLSTALAACVDDDAGAGDAGVVTPPTIDASAGREDGSQPGPDAASDAPEADGGDAGKIIPPGLLEPIPYLSKADNPFEGVAFGSYYHFEDWEDGMVNTPGVTPSSTQLGSSFGAALIDSIDGDDGVVDGKCQKADGGTCNSGFANGTIQFTFDAAALGALPTHVGIAWTDGSTNCDAVFEAYDDADTPIGTKTASAVGDNSNFGTVPEDRYFGVVHPAGVKRIVVKSSAGGVEVDHLVYAR